MFREFFLFELFYRKSRAVTYVYFVMTFLLCFLGVASSVIKLGSSVGFIKANAPYVIYRMTLVASFILSIITSSIMGVTIIRDFDHKMDGILFSAPIKKWNYLLGRFCGSFAVLVIINLALPVGFIAGFAIGQYVPWEIAWKSQSLLPFNFWNYIHPFLLILLPNLFVTSAFFFMGGALGRKSIVIYLQGILLIVLYQIANGYLRDLDSQFLAAIIDPFGIQTFLYTTRYWTPVEQNALFVPFDGVMMYNRLLWTGAGIIALFATYRIFSFHEIQRSDAKRTRLKLIDDPQPGALVELDSPPVINVSGYLTKILESSFFHFRMIWREIPFLAIVSSGILLLFLNTSRINSIYGTGTYPTTASMLEVINNSFNLFFLIIVIFYSGELIWKERSVHFDLIVDSLPVPNALTLSAKFISLILTYISLILILIVSGIASQIALGYFRFDLPSYFGTLFGSTFISLILFTLLSFFIHVVVNNKFGGFSLIIAFIIINALLSQFGLEHDLWQFGSGNLGPLSEINLYGHFITPFVWFKIYWMAFALILFVLAIVFSVRGAETSLLLRWKAGKFALTKPVLMFGIFMVCTLLLSGCYIYYNTNVINKFEGQWDAKIRQADYEKKFRKYREFNQPKIVASNITLNLYPFDRYFTASGYYYLKNKSLQPIKDIHVQGNWKFGIVMDALQFDRIGNIKEGNSDFRYYIYELIDPLRPGDSVRMSFALSFATKGFVESGSNTDIVYNGTFLSNTYFPGIGYNDAFELRDKEDRIKCGLQDLDSLSTGSRSEQNTVNVIDHNVDRVRLEMHISTESDQVAIAPGNLQKTWKEGGRTYFHYKMDSPVSNSYSIVSGRFKLKRDRWKNVELEIYYHPGHEFNISRLMKGMKDGLDYYSANFSPFQFTQLRIVEFPRYRTSAESFANTIPFSETGSFISNVKRNGKNIDMVYYSTVHEVAHQWWGEQVIAANTKGSSMLSEGIAQYSALMTMKHATSDEIVERCLKYELDNYLRGRSQERRKESPLVSVSNQPYLSRNKSSIIFFGLQDYIGEENFNSALRAYNKLWAFKDAHYPSSTDLIKQISLVMPDSLKYLLHDMFETVTLFENRALEAGYKEIGKGKYELTLSASCEKFIIDDTGQEKDIPVNDWIDVGVFALGTNGKEKLIYLKKIRITQKDNLFIIPVSGKPTRVGIDPLHKLIDRHSDDNIISANQFIEITNLTLDQ